MKDQNSILFKQSNLYIKSTIELPPSLVFSKSIFLTQYTNLLIINEIFLVVESDISK